jgi:toxin FitB
MSYLLDTNVVSEIRKVRPDERVATWFESVDSGHLYLSVLVVGEIRQGIDRLNRRDPTQAAVFATWLAALKRSYADRVLDIDREIAETWGTLNAVRPLPVVDGLLAATALVHDLTLVTRDEHDLVDAGVRVLDPFAQSR